MSKPFKVKFQLEFINHHLTIRSTTTKNLDRLSNDELPTIQGYIKTVQSVFDWMRSFLEVGIFFDYTKVDGWVKNSYRYQMAFKCPHTGDDFKKKMMTYFGSFELDFNENFEETEMIKKAPFSLWGIHALKQSLLEDGMTKSELSKFSEGDRDKLINMCEKRAELEDDEAEGNILDQIDKIESAETIDEDEEYDEEIVEEGDEIEEVVAEEMVKEIDGIVKPVPEDIGAATIDRKLKEKGLWDKVVAKMAVGDKMEYFSATPIRRIEMAVEISKTEAKKIDKPVIDAKQNPSETKPNLNEKLKKKNLWRPGMQFLSNELKQNLLDAKNETDREEIFEIVEKKQAGIKKKQAKKANISNVVKKGKL